MYDRITNENMPWMKHPECITVEIMTVCNLKCSHCYMYNSNGGQNKLMDFGRFVEIAERLAPLISKASSFNIASVEGLLHPRIFDMVDVVRGYNSGLSIPIFTNGMLIDEAIVRKMLSMGLRDLHISLDGCSKKTVESFKTGAVFEKIIDAVITIRKVGGKDIRLSSIFVAHKNNILELLDYVDLCCDLGIDHIDITGFISYGNEFSDLPIYSERGNDAVDLLFSAAVERARNRGVTLCHRGSRLKDNDFFCGSAHTVYVTEEGNMTPCVVLARPTSMALRGEAGISKQLVFGNIFQTHPEILWQSACYSFFRKQFFSGALPGPCALCPMAYGVIC